ncbi:MAG: hypothetical protein UU67_C0035G0009, partial [Candidatus Daviesbacteria bacterium GW2011_GWB1_41_5]
PYKVCILAAGAGSAMDHLDEHVNKAVLPVNNKAVISYMIEKFPEDVEIIVAVGHKKETVVDYLKLAYPERVLTFVEIKKFVGPGTGPGYSLLQCKKHLQCPFIFSTADTIVAEDILPPDQNWIGIAPVHETEQYCTVKIRNNVIYQLDDKIKTDNHFAFIGLAGIKDYKEFFKALENDKRAIAGEVQVSNGFKVLVEKKLSPIGFTWFDTGHSENYIETNKNFSGESKFDFSKTNEFLYFVNGRVIKFFADKSVVDKRHERSQKGLKGITPKIEAKRGNFYAYKMLEGNTLYSMLNAKLTQEFLSWAKTHLWKKAKLDAKQQKIFQDAVKKFYKDKTEERIALYEKKHGRSEAQMINGINVPKARELLSKVNWAHIMSGEAVNFHGDLQFDNVLVRSGAKSAKDKFALLDWRHEFGGLTHVGDLYYDLAKLYGGLTISYPLIKEGMFSAEGDGDEVHYHYFVRSDLLEAREYYEEFLREEGYDLKKIKTLTAIIFLNMSPLHHGPFDKMLHSLGRSMLHKTLEMR